MSEEFKWINETLAGDTDSYRHIVSRYKNAVFSVAYGILGDYHLAEDAAQETFLQAFLRLRDLQEPDKISSWLYSISYRLCIRMKDRNKRLVLQDDMSKYHTVSESTETTVVRRQDYAQIWHSISELDDKNRITTALYYMCDLSMREIAGFLGISVSAVESRLQRAKKQLRISLSQFDEAVMRGPFPGQSFEERIMREIPSLMRIPCIFVDVNDADCAMTWYESVLGIDFNCREPKGGVNIAFQERLNPTPSKDPILTFATPSALEAHSALKSKRVNIISFSPDGHSFMFEDPFGNVLAFVEE